MAGSVEFCFVTAWQARRGEFCSGEVGPGMATQACCGRSWLGSAGEVRPGEFRSGGVWQGKFWLGRYGQSRHGAVRRGLSRRVPSRQARHGRVRCGELVQVGVRRVAARQARHEVAWRGQADYGPLRQENKTPILRSGCFFMGGQKT
jgi:hypothetical protein